MKADHDVAEITAPPNALLSHNPIRWLRFFGPGAVVASCTIGTGEVLFSSRGGSIFGYSVLWVLLLASLLKWVLCYSSMRHMIISGAHPFDRWNHIAGPYGWFPLFMWVIALISFPIWNSFLAGVLGTACKWVFGPQQFFMGHDTYGWASVSLILAMVALLIGNYRVLEIAQVVLVILMMACMVVAVVMLRPDPWKIIDGIFVPRIPQYPSWVKELSEFKDRTTLLEISVYISAIGGASFDYIAYLSLLRNKKWGASASGVLPRATLEKIAEQMNHQAKVWVRAAVIDTSVSFGAIAFLAVCFSILGTSVLAPQQIVPKDEDLLNYQAQYLSSFAPWMVPIYKAAIFAAFSSILYGGPEMNFRVVVEYIHSTVRFRDRFPQHQLRTAFVIWCLMGGLVLLWINWAVRQYVAPEFSLVRMISPVGVYTGVLTCGLYCLLNPWMDWKFLPASLRMSRFLAAMNLLASVVFVVVGVRALWDEWWYTEHKWHAYLFLGVLVAIAMLAAKLLRRYLHEPAQQDTIFQTEI